VRPVKGVVITVAGLALEVKLESGPTIHFRKKHSLRIGDPVDVLYDFTKSRVRDVQPYDGKSEETELNVEEPAEEETPGEDDDIDEVPMGGVLRPLGGGQSELWTLDSGVLVLSACFTRYDHSDHS